MAGAKSQNEQALKSLIQSWRNREHRERIKRERERISRLPRFQPGVAHFWPRPFKFIDSASFLSAWEEIFQKQIYKFPSPSWRPNIIDCGSNVGVSVLFFKKYFPTARVTAFEPDPDIFECLSENVREFQLSDVVLEQSAVWSSDEYVCFHREGADAGQVSESGIQVRGTALRRVLLSGEVDFLKIDIEGAEYEVLESCRGAFAGVHRLFVETHDFRGQRTRVPELLELLTAEGFRIHIHSPNARDFPFMNDGGDSPIELQLNIFAYRGKGPE